jgi:hypothetical protein
MGRKRSLASILDDDNDNNNDNNEKSKNPKNRSISDILNEGSSSNRPIN